GGQIGNVPLLLSNAAGAWRLDGGALGVTGALDVRDAAAVARFKPLVARDVALTLKDSKITATGTLIEPAKNVRVAALSIAHDLSRGAGQADLTVDGITFGDGFQPTDLTPLTLGIVADVKGTVSGVGHIRWTDAGVTSDGTFRTAGIDLAAALGPVSGIAGQIRFTDLLALESAPGQVVTIKSINPGVPVNDGTIRFQTLANARVRIEDGRWPFAGGSLVLEPTLLDFGEAQERDLTFRVTGMDAAQFLQQFDFKNLDATGTFDGVLPMVFDINGGRIENGHLVVRRGGGTIAYVGELSEKDLGFWGNAAFQTLKSLKYRSVDIVMNGPLAGEMVTQVRFAGVGQGVGAKRNFLVSRLAKLPFVFNVTIKAPFRQLIDSAQSLYDPKRLLDQQRDQLLAPASTPPLIQPTESRKMP
nr:YdbH domain-containing protein [Pseudomonadota bacterium]